MIRLLVDCLSLEFKAREAGIVGEMRPFSDGPDRKYFSLTKEGRERLEEFWNQWQDLGHKVEREKAGET